MVDMTLNDLYAKVKVSGVNPGGVLGSGPHQLFPLPGSAYWWTRARFSKNISVW